MIRCVIGRKNFFSNGPLFRRIFSNFSEIVGKFPNCGDCKVENALTLHPGSSKNVIYAILFGRLSSPSTLAATTLLLRAEKNMQSRLSEAGTSLQVVFCPSDPDLELINRSDAYRTFLVSLNDHWRAVPLSSAYDFIKSFVNRVPIGSASQSGSPQLIFVDSNGRIILQEGIRHLALDRGAIGFPWAPAGGAIAGLRDGSVRHILSPLTLTRAPQEGVLTSVLILTPCNHQKSMSIFDQCHLLDRYRDVASAVYEEFNIPSGQASFFYSAEREIWEAGLANLQRIGIVSPSLLPSVHDALEKSGEAAAVLLIIWSEGYKSGRQAASYVVSSIEHPSSEVLQPAFFIHPGLKFDRKVQW